MMMIIQISDLIQISFINCLRLQVSIHKFVIIQTTFIQRNGLISTIKKMNADEHQEDSQNYRYFQQFCQLAEANSVLFNELRQLLNERTAINHKFMKIQKKYEQSIENEDQDSKKKRIRRTASQIQRKYRCPIQICQKSYGVEGSLNQHIKLKHPELFQKMMEKQANESMKQQVSE